MGRIPDFFREHVVTTAIFLICIYTFLAMLFTAYVWGVDAISYWFVLSPGFTPTPAWVLSLFAHVSFPHLLANVLGILILGSYLEERLPKPQLVSVYLVTGILSGLIHTNITGLTGAGASGAVLGWGGFYCVHFLKCEWTDNPSDRVELMQFGIALALPLAVGFEFLFRWWAPNMTESYAHLCGMLLGLLYGWVYVTWAE